MHFILYIYATSFIIFLTFAVLGEAYQVLNDPLHLLKKKNDPLIEMEIFCISRYDFMLAVRERYVSFILPLK